MRLPVSLPPTVLELSGERIVALYALAGEESAARQLAEHLCVEQTIEFPVDLLPDDDIRHHLVAKLEDFQPAAEAGRWLATVSFAEELSAFAGPQLLNLLFGNISLAPGVKLLDFQLSARIVAGFSGPRFGVAGLRRLLGAPRRPLLATALKPLGLAIEELAAMAADFVEGGIDLIKDDHGLADQPFASFAERVRRISTAVDRANQRHGRRSLYLPSLNVAAEQLLPAAELVAASGARGAMVLPGLHGFDALRALAANDDLGLVLMAHPAFLGGWVSSPASGLDHSLVFGRLPRLFGADISVFPNFGGRFSFTSEQCAGISAGLGSPWSGIASALPAPAGGMSLERVGEMIDFYGRDVGLLIGGDLHRGPSRVERAARLRELAAAAV